MNFFWYNIWNSATGPIKHFAPQTRIISGVFIFLICLMAPVDSLYGIGFASACLLYWFLFCRPRLRILRTPFIFGLVVLGPYFLFTLITYSETGDLIKSLMGPWRVFFHGMYCLLVTVSLFSSLSLSDLRSGLLTLHIPKMVGLILLQIIHQTMILFSETKQISHAIILRGVRGRYRSSLSVLTTLPKVWFPRIINRADRVAVAMDIRGYVELDLTTLGSEKYTWKDILLIITHLILFAIAILILIWECG